MYNSDHAIHRFSASLSLNELQALSNSLGFLSAYKDRSYLKLATTRTPEFISLSPTYGLWPRSNYGQGAIIGVIDSDIWPEKVSFHDHDMKHKTISEWNGSCIGGKHFNSSLCYSKIIGVRYFDKGLKEKYGKLAGTESARDTNGHWDICFFHIAAGNYVDEVSYFGYAKGTAKGVAPFAKLAIYKVAWN